MEKKTPLYGCHERAKGKIVPFAGYLLPIQYTGVINEHMAVRTKAGLFDVSHMGEFILSGADALGNLNYLLTNDYSGMKDGQARYSPMCNEKGGMIDDLIVYKYSDTEYLLVVNAANRDKDFQWISGNLRGDAKVCDVSDNTALIALQGPNSELILSKLTTEIPQKRFTAYINAKVQNIDCLISRTGYTGEDGFELYCDSLHAVTLWNALLEAGEQHGLIPCGLGARDTLRLEAAMPLYGHEMNDDITPLETGLSYFVKMHKDDFIGKKAMLEKNSGLHRVGIKVIDKGIAREGCDVFSNNVKIGKTTSGTHCPFLKGAYAMALIEGAEHSDIEVEVRGKRLKAEIVKLPFYRVGS